jgi:hypothetical protein
MLDKIFSRQSRLEHPDPVQRLQGIAELAADSDDLQRVLVADPAPIVRAAAARQSTNVAALSAALGRETDPEVRGALLESLGAAADPAHLQDILGSATVADCERVAVAQRAPASAQRHAAIATLQGEDALLDVALTAGHAETRMAAAERVHSKDNLHKLAEQSRNRDNGVARLARQRLDAIKTRETQGAEADAILTELEALALEPGPILTAVVELNRRWQALDLSGDTKRLARCESARQVIQERFDREQEEQRAKAAFERRVREWSDALAAAAAATTDALVAARATLAELRDEGARLRDTRSQTRLDEAEQRIAAQEREHAAHAGAEALVIEAEKLAADTSIDNADLPSRWQALDRSTRTPELTRRFEAALMTVEQRRLAQIQAPQQETNAVRLRLHNLLHAAEQALAAGQLHAARAATEEIRTLKTAAGMLPKPTVQRLSRAIQQLVDLERWESFGQNNARVQLCERAEALAAQTGDFGTLAQEVQKLRNEWKALDQQYSGVPKALWERFDRACERAYAPAAKHFAELAAQRKDARKKREEFIAAAAAHAPTLVADPPDLRAIERWLRETDHAWREGDLGSVDPGMWKKLDAKLKEAIAPARDALGAARDKAKAGRQALIDEVKALAAKASERDAPTQVKAIQARWQEHARATSLAQRDERALWDQFRAACDAVFEARQAKRKEEDSKKSEHRRALEDVATELEALARASDKTDQDLKRALRDAQDKWKKLTATFDPAVREVEPRFRRARTAAEAAIAGRARSREAALWQVLAAKERLCEDLDRAVASGADPNAAQVAMNEVQQRWGELAELPAAQEKRMAARRDASVVALTDASRAPAHASAVAANGERRREMLLELELALELDSPAPLAQQRLALQVRQLKDRFKTAAAAISPGDRLLEWCATAGVCDPGDRQRAERIFAKSARAGG